MKVSAYSHALKAFIRKQGADGVPVAEICRRAGISPATYFNWKNQRLVGNSCEIVSPPTA